MALHVVFSPAQERRHYATEVIRTQNVAMSRRGTKRNNNDVMKIQDFFGPNIFACICCCPIIALVGLIFSLLCQSAKYKGKRKQAECFSVMAGAMFVLSIIMALIIAVFMVHIQYSET